MALFGLFFGLGVSAGLVILGNAPGAVERNAAVFVAVLALGVFFMWRYGRREGHAIAMAKAAAMASATSTSGVQLVIADSGDLRSLLAGAVVSQQRDVDQVEIIDGPARAAALGAASTPAVESRSTVPALMIEGWAERG